ncbi:hypothetical protein JVU11DRAFT_8218 [Chiua virens]|nr:hypothetical protein JVU11DRAFT_8218 [Chiua virens]
MAVFQRRHAHAITVAGLAILVFDYTITFEDEFVIFCSVEVSPLCRGRDDCLWCASPWEGFFLSFADKDPREAALRTSTDPCPQSLDENIIHTLGIIAAEGPSSGLVLEHHMNVVRDKVLLILRTYAFWQGDKRVLYGLLAYGSATIGAAVAINVSPKQLIPGGKSLTRLAAFSFITSHRRSTPRLPFDCLPKRSVACFAIAAKADLCLITVILSLTAYKRFRSYRGVRTPIMLTVYRDGMFYMFCIIRTIITFSNMILDGVFPMQFTDLLDIPQITLHSVLASRIMFNLRKSFHYQGEDQSTNSVSLGDLRYYSPSDPQPQRVPIETTSSGSSSGAPV